LKNIFNKGKFMLSKDASTDLPIHELIRRRWSPRAFASTAVAPEILHRIFEAARWAPSGSNLQPWHFIVGFSGDETYKAIYSTLVEFNQLWASTAPVLLLSIAKETNSRNEPNASHKYDVGQSVAFMSIQAMDEGVYLHQMGGFDRELAGRLLNVPENYNVVTAVALGYPGNPDLLHENLKRLEYAPRVRKPLNEFVFTGKFGEKATFIP
jgi:nitroreductase